jgi:hypothetical protein
MSILWNFHNRKYGTLHFGGSNWFIQHATIQWKNKNYSLIFQQKPIELLHLLPIPEERWEQVSINFITPLPETSHGNTGILVVVDRFSKMMHAIPIPSPCTAIATARLYHDSIYRYHGLPRTIVSNRDPIFMSHFWTNLFSMTGVKLTSSSSYHPQNDGQTEVVNKKIEEILR